MGLLVVGEDLVRVLYSGGGDGFSDDGVARASAVLSGYALAVWAYSLNQLLTRAFYAKGDTRTPMTIALGMVGVNLAMNCALIWWLREAGLAWSTAICALGQTGLLMFAAHKKLGVGFTGISAGVMRVVVGSLIMGLFIGWLVKHEAAHLQPLRYFLATGVLGAVLCGAMDGGSGCAA